MTGGFKKGEGAGMRLILSLIRPLRRRLVLAVTATIVATAAALVPPYLAGRVVNDVVETGSSSELVGISIALGIALAINALASGAEAWLVGEVGQRGLMDLRTRIVAKFHRLPMSYYDENSDGHAIAPITNSVDSLNVLVAGGLNLLISSVLVILGTAAVMVVLDWRLALVTLFVFPFLATISVQFPRLVLPAWRHASKKLEAVTTYVQEGMAGREVVRGFGQEDRHVEDFEVLNADNESAHVRPMTLNLLLGPGAEFVSLLGLAAVIAYGAHEAIGGAIQIGVVVAFLAYLRQALAPLPQLASLYSSVERAVASLDSIGALLEHEEDPGQVPGRAPAPPLAGGLAFERVWFAYEGDQWVLSDIDLEIAPGERIALVGASGSGKTTFVKLTVGFYPPARGRIAFDGRDLSELDLRSVRRQLSYVPQEPFLFMGTVTENIAWGDEMQNGTGGTPPVERAWAAARAVGVLDALEGLPEGLETQVGEGGGLLSLGQRQLVALARSMARDPRILILDEATSNIDSATEAEVQAGIEKLLRDRTSIVVAHRLSTVARADRVVVIEKGRIREMGSPAELRAAGGAFAQLEHEYGGDDQR